MKNIDNVFNRSKNFSHNIIERLQKVDTLNNAFICGSVSRYEAFHMADIDILYFGKCNNLEVINIENVDRIDYIRMDDIIANRLIENMSPESGFLDCKPILGNQNHKFYSRYNDSQFLLNRFIWEYHFRFLTFQKF